MKIREKTKKRINRRIFGQPPDATAPSVHEQQEKEIVDQVRTRGEVEVRRKMKSLVAICLVYVGANFHTIALGRFSSMPPELRQKFLQSVCTRTKITPREFQFFLDPLMMSLDLTQCRNLNENHFELVTKLNHLVTLNVAGCVGVTYDVLQRIVEACPDIRQLTLSGCPKVLLLIH
jgi:hypothetical protein